MFLFSLMHQNLFHFIKRFRWLWKKVGENLETFTSFPRLSGECGGKNFHLVHASADVESASVATLRSAFEYSGQKCSACSRLYVPASMWARMRDLLGSMLAELQVNTPLQFDTFTSAVIDERSFDRITSYIEYGKKNKNVKLIFGGQYDKSKGEPNFKPRQKRVKSFFFLPPSDINVCVFARK